MFSVNYAECCKQAHYAECRYAECRGALFRAALCRLLLEPTANLHVNPNLH
jgi:hypothetical protein